MGKSLVTLEIIPAGDCIKTAIIVLHSIIICIINVTIISTNISLCIVHKSKSKGLTLKVLLHGKILRSIIFGLQCEVVQYVGECRSSSLTSELGGNELQQSV